MTQVNIPYVFTNQTTADANQVDQNFTAIATTINGNLDDSNIKPASLTGASLANEGVKPAKTEGIPYAQDLFSNGFVMSGTMAVTQDGTNANQVNVTAGTAYVKQPDGSLRRIATSATNFKTASPNNTYNLDLQPDGTWFWNVGHSTQTGYINIAAVTSDASSNVNTVTQNPAAYNVTLVGTVTNGNPLNWFVR